MENAKKDLEWQNWGLHKTNEAIKSLYKDLERKNKSLEKLDQLKSDFVSNGNPKINECMVSILCFLHNSKLGKTCFNDKFFFIFL